MPHGSRDYFLEIRRFRRRLALVISIVSLGALALEAAVLVPLPGAPLARRLPRTPFFGFEGPERYVRRIILETSGPPGPRPGQPTILYRSVSAVRGGRSDTRPSTDPHARPETRPVGQGPGDSSEDLLARARMIYGGSAPVIQSEDLVIERLVKPEYPAVARELNIEGLVAFVALVDTTGAVTRVDLLSSNGEHLLEQAAEAAIRQCRFRPYRVNDRPVEVNAVFRFSFRIYGP